MNDTRWHHVNILWTDSSLNITVDYIYTIGVASSNGKDLGSVSEFFIGARKNSTTSTVYGGFRGCIEGLMTWINFYFCAIQPLIIHQRFSLARDWLKCITWLNISQLKVRNNQFSVCCEKYLIDNIHNNCWLLRTDNVRDILIVPRSPIQCKRIKILPLSQAQPAEKTSPCLFFFSSVGVLVGNKEININAGVNHNTARGCESQMPSHCLSNPCPSYSTCQEQFDSYRCVCPAGYVGKSCVNVCSLKPCRNGRCEKTETQKGFQCVCPKQYTGKRQFHHC